MKFFLFLAASVFVVGGGWLVISKGYDLLVQANVADWQAKKVVVDGVNGPLQKQLLALITPYQDQPFPAEKSVSLRETISRKFPMLKRVKVKRGLLRGTLTVSAERRTPLARVKPVNGPTRYLDADGVIYPDADVDTPAEVVSVVLEGPVPGKLETHLVELVQHAVKWRKELAFTSLHINLTDNTVQMYLPDESVIDFGPAVQLKNKATRAVQIWSLARKKYPVPFVLDFRFFENGKVFLTQRAH